MYAFVIGFMASSLWSQINTEDDQARSEGAHSYPEAAKALKRLYVAYEQVQPHTDFKDLVSQLL